ncbi:MAG: septum formation initiator [Rikenellaceae bacterium]
MVKYLIKLMHYTRANRWTILTLVISLVMIVTIGRNAWHGVVISTQIAELEHERNIYLEEIRRDSTLIERLKDDDELARYARERYYMRRKGEDLFILK